ncbi:hypothetical protein MKX03_001578, partial [Papaver bracteatum]
MDHTSTPEEKNAFIASWIVVRSLPVVEGVETDEDNFWRLVHNHFVAKFLIPKQRTRDDVIHHVKKILRHVRMYAIIQAKLLRKLTSGSCPNNI